MTSAQPELKESGAHSLIQRLRKDPGVSRALRTLRDGEKRLHVSGLRGASVAFFAEAVRDALGRPVVICCPEEERARDIWSDLQTVSGAGALIFPEKDIFPQRYEMRENLAVRGGRNGCLDRILQGDAGIVVTSILGFLEKTYPVELFRSSRRTLHNGDTIDLEELRSYLVRLGYEFSSVVEEMGQYAVRG
ncbi:MAG: hypothetical protein ABIA59_11165, partial [Candidatus Latescibacterota bacterium]